MITLFRDSAAGEETHTPPGGPPTRYRVHATGEGGRLSAGEWRAGVGAWAVDYTEWEFVHVVAGRARLTGIDDMAVEVGPGDAFTIAPGFRGTWEVIEPMTKHFVILDPQP